MKHLRKFSVLLIVILVMGSFSACFAGKTKDKVFSKNDISITLTDKYSVQSNTTGLKLAIYAASSDEMFTCEMQPRKDSPYLKSLDLYARAINDKNKTNIEFTLTEDTDISYKYGEYTKKVGADTFRYFTFLVIGKTNLFTNTFASKEKDYAKKVDGFKKMAGTFKAEGVGKVVSEVADKKMDCETFELTTDNTYSDVVKELGINKSSSYFTSIEARDYDKDDIGTFDEFMEAVLALLNNAVFTVLEDAVLPTKATTYTFTADKVKYKSYAIIIDGVNKYYSLEFYCRETDFDYFKADFLKFSKTFAEKAAA